MPLLYRINYWVTLLSNSESLLLTGNLKQLTLLMPHSYRVQSHAQCANETPIIILDCQTGCRPVKQTNKKKLSETRIQHGKTPSCQ